MRILLARIWLIYAIMLLKLTPVFWCVKKVAWKTMKSKLLLRSLKHFWLPDVLSALKTIYPVLHLQRSIIWSLIGFLSAIRKLGTKEGWVDLLLRKSRESSGQGVRSLLLGQENLFPELSTLRGRLYLSK